MKYSYKPFLVNGKIDWSPIFLKAAVSDILVLSLALTPRSGFWRSTGVRSLCSMTRVGEHGAFWDETSYRSYPVQPMLEEGGRCSLETKGCLIRHQTHLGCHVLMDLSGSQRNMTRRYRLQSIANSLSAHGRDVWNPPLTTYFKWGFEF